MAGITLAQAEAKLAEHLAAETEALKSQELGIKDHKVVRAELASIRDGIKFWDDQVKRLSSGSTGRRVRGVTPY